MNNHDVVVVGGGFFGCFAAQLIAQRGHDVALIERGPSLLPRASSINQGRVHGGYHYPLCAKTALGSFRGYQRFLRDFEDCIDRSGRHHYAIAARGSHVDTAEFESFCRDIGAPLAPADPDVMALFSPGMIASCFRVDEAVVDSTRLQLRMTRSLAEEGVDTHFETHADRIVVTNGDLVVHCTERGQPSTFAARHVLDCTYSELGRLGSRSGDVDTALSLRLAEVAMVRAPKQLAGLGLTVIYGPFFSLLPRAFGSEHTLTHVVHSHAPANAPREVRFEQMLHEAAQFVPVLAGATHVSSQWEVKASSADPELLDSRPLIVRASTEVPGLVTVLGSKLDVSYDLEPALAALGL